VSFFPCFFVVVPAVRGDVLVRTGRLLDNARLKGPGRSHGGG